MGQIVTKFSDGSYLEYDSGSFDDWCVYLTRPNQLRYAPKDYQYFMRLDEYGQKYGRDKVYNDFVKFYEITTKFLDNNIFDLIKTIAKDYVTDEIEVAIDFSIIYMGMVAEENKRFTRLGKRVKRLGVYQVLIDNLPYNTAANFSRGKNWRELDKICWSKGF